MPLAARVLHIPAGLGIDQATREELVEAGQANLANENVRQEERGGLCTRRGFRSVTLNRYDATTRSAGHKVFSVGDVPFVIDGTHCDAYDSESDTWKTIGRVPEADYELTPLPAAGMSLSAVEIASANGYIAVAYRGQTGNATSTDAYAYASIVNASTGAVVRLPEQVGTSNASPGFTLVNVASYSDRYFIIIVSYGTGGSGGQIDAFYLDTNTAATIQAGWVSIGTVTAIWDDASDPVVESLSNRVALAFANTSGGTDRVTVDTLTIAGVAETRTVNTSSTSPTVIALAGSIADTLWLAWNETTAVKLIGIDADAMASTLATTATIITAGAAPSAIFLAPNTSVAGKGRLYVATDATSSATSYMRGFQTTTGAAATDGSLVTFLAARMMGRPTMRSGRYYGMFRTSSSRVSFGASTTQGNAILSDWTDDVSYVRPVSSVAPGLVVADAMGLLVGGGLSVAIDSKLYAVLNIKKSAAGQAPSLVAFDFAATTRWQTAVHNGGAFLSGGLLSVVTPNRIAEACFLSKPAKPTTATSGTGITLATGARYVAVYEEVDGAGNWCVSGISDPSASTGAVTNHTITVTTTPLTVSSRLSSTDQVTGVRVVFYRTLDGGSPPYYRAGVALNSTGSAVTFADAVSDATLATQTKLYAPNLPSSVGEKLDRRAPPGLGSPVSCNGVLVGARGSVLYYSGQPVDGEETWFSPIFQAPVDGDGDITGLGAQDGTIYALKRRAVYAVPVEAPADNGTAGGLGSPRRLAVDVGCIDARSIVVTSLGIFFQSERGIELLTRAQSVEWIGERVEDTLASYPIVTAATLDPVANVVYFELAASTAESTGLASGNGRTLVFDLAQKQWVSIDRRAGHDGTADTPAQSSAIVWDGTRYRYAWLETGGRMRVEADAWIDVGSANTFITPMYEVPAVKAGLQQQQKVWGGTILLERHSAAGLKIEHAYDWAAYSASDDKTWSESQTSGKRQLEWRPRLRGSSMRMRISATSPASLAGDGAGRGFTFVGISIDFAPKQGSTKGTPHLDPAGRQ